MTYHSNKKIILICGYAQSGKDTFADGILETVNKDRKNVNPMVRANFADPLKNSVNLLCSSLGVETNYLNEKYKNENRGFLINVARFIRSKNQDAFAKQFCNYVANIFELIPKSPGVICSDWRYLNELDLIRSFAKLYNIEIITIYISTNGIHPIHEEEGLSIGEVLRNVQIDYNYNFEQNSGEAVKEAGINFAKNRILL